jgi:hypothetical protein
MSLTIAIAPRDQVIIWSRSLSRKSRSARLRFLLMPPGNRARAVNLLSGRAQDDLLAVLAHQHRLRRQLRILEDHADDVADLRVGVEAEQQIRRREVEEVQRVRLEHLAVVHQPPHLFRRRRQLVRADDHVGRLGRREVVADRANAAQTLHQHGHFPIRPALDEAFEAAEFHDMETRPLDPPVVVDEQRDLAVPLDAGDGFDDNATFAVSIGAPSKAQSYFSSP